MLATARALRAAGHQPVIIGPADLTARVPNDVETRTVGVTDLGPGRLDTICECLSRMGSLSDVRQMFSAVAILSKFYLDNLPDAVEDLQASAILHDQLEPAAGIVARGLAMRSGLAHISLACALPMNRDPSVPPPFMGWRYRRGRFGAWLNGGYYNVVNWLLSEQGRILEAGAERFGLLKKPGLEDWQRAWSVDDGLSRTTDLAQGLASLDFPRERPPTYLGPFREAERHYPGLDAIAMERDGRPLAFISLGTLMGGRSPVLAAMARAATARGLQPVVVHGGRLNAETAAMPRGTILRDFLDQRDILSEAEAAIIHGGYNSTTDAVAAGVPVVTVPQAFEQGAIAARVERAGLGRTVGLFGPSLSQRIQLALGDVLSSKAVAQAVRRTRFEAMAAPGLGGLVAAVDGVLSDRTPTQPLRENVHQSGRWPMLIGQPAE